MQVTLSLAVPIRNSAQEEFMLSLPDNSTRQNIATNTPLQTSNRSLYKEVLGFYPYWIPQDEYKRMPINLLSIIAWASITPKSDGTLIAKQGWPPTKMIAYAHSKNVKVIVVVSSVDKTVIDPILASPAKQSILTNNLLSMVESAGMDGINIDFEGLNQINSVSGESNRYLIVNFVKNLSMRFWTENPSYHISIDLPNNDWDNIWDVATLQDNSTALMIMGYDIYYRKSRTAGPTAPLDDYPGELSVRKSVDAYLAKGIKKEKLLLGVPYYGYIWPTVSDGRKSATTGAGEYVPYTDMVNKSTIYGRRWDPIWKTPWFAYKVGTQWYEGYYDDNESLGMKYDLVLEKDIAGIGIWHIGAARGRSELWQEIYLKFTDHPALQVSIITPPDSYKYSSNINITPSGSLNNTIEANHSIIGQNINYSHIMPVIYIAAVTVLLWRISKRK